MNPTLIVHPTDLSAVSEGAFHHALKLGLAARCRLSLVHVHASRGEEPARLSDFPQVRETLERWGLLEDGAPQSDVAEKLGVQVAKGEIQAASPERGLARLLETKGAALVVLGTRGLSGLQRLFERSFSEQLARTAKIPALFVPSDAAGFVRDENGAVRLRNVLIPVAEDPSPVEAIAVAQHLCDLLGQEAKLHLLHVGEVDAAKDVGARGATILRKGPIEETIVSYADEIDADVIVMATAGHKGFLDALRGSSTEMVLRRSRRAVLAVPAN